MANNKIVYGSEVLIDLTADTVTADKLAKGITAHNMAGEVIEGTNTFDSDTSDATIQVAEMLAQKTAYARGAKLTGTMPNNGAISKKITTKDELISIPIGFHDGSGTVGIDTNEQKKIVAGNIKQGISILGIEGSYSGEGLNLQSKTVTPSKIAQTIQADAGYDALSSVTVKAIPYTETPNSAGGTTVTIG